jgi:hypothetical protein
MVAGLFAVFEVLFCSSTLHLLPTVGAGLRTSASIFAPIVFIQQVRQRLHRIAPFHTKSSQDVCMHKTVLYHA